MTNEMTLKQYKAWKIKACEQAAQIEGNKNRKDFWMNPVIGTTKQMKFLRAAMEAPDVKMFLAVI